MVNTWEIETYEARYITYASSSYPTNYAAIDMESKQYSHGIHASISVFFDPNSRRTGSVAIPSYEGSDWDHEYYLTLPLDQFDTLREFLDSESPIEFVASHADTPSGSSQEVPYWLLRTGATEPVGEEESKLSLVKPFRAFPDEVLSDEAKEIAETLTTELDLNESLSESS